MANYATLKSTVQNVVKTNGNNEITGALLQQVLLSIINSIGFGYQFVGVANPGTNPGTPDQRVFYLASAGTYPNFGPAEVPTGSLGVFYYNNTWHVDTIAFPIGEGTITETNLAAVLVNKLFLTGYKFAGIATPSTTPGTPNQNIFYIGGPGTYKNFGEQRIVDEGQLGFFKYDNTWTFETVQVGETNTVKYVLQSLTNEQKEQARANIGAAFDEDLNQLELDMGQLVEQIGVLYKRLFIKTHTLWQNSSSANWLSGNISNGSIVTSYANRYIIISIPSGVSKITVHRTAIDAVYKLSIFGSSNGTTFTGIEGKGTQSGDWQYTLGNYNRILFLLWDRPSTARAQQEVLSITYETESEVLNKADVVDNLSSRSTSSPLSANQGRVLNEAISNLHQALNEAIRDLQGGLQYYNLVWKKGNIRPNDTIDTSYSNKYANYIELQSLKMVVSNSMSTNKILSIFHYNENFVRLGSNDCFVGETKEIVFESSAKYFRLLAWDKTSDTDVQNVSVAYLNQDTLLSLRQAINEISGGSEFQNPVLRIDAPDPCIVDGQDGFFYMLVTGTLATKTMYRSTNLIDWEEADVPFTAQAIADCYADFGISSMIFWAPEIVKIGDKYNIYLSKESNPMVVFQSKHPNFGYEYKGKIITTSNGLPGDNIDACVRYDLDGTLWMFWGSIYGIYRQKLTADGLALDTNDTKEHVAGKLLSQDSSRATVFEAAYLYRRKGYWYLFVSAGSYATNSYCLKVGRSATLNGSFLDKDGNNMVDGYATTILSSVSGDVLYGPGHNGAIITDRNNRAYMIYHAHYTGASSNRHRYICLQELMWDADGWPYFANNKPQVFRNIKPTL